MVNTIALLDKANVLGEKDWFRQFQDFDVSKFGRLLQTKPDYYWEEQGAKRALRIFHSVAERVPAYKDFLKVRGIKHRAIKTIDDFKKYVPPTSKANYIQQYEAHDLCWDGKIERTHIVAVSSGTTGNPQMWPRTNYQEFETSILHELLYTNNFGIDKSKTLLVIGFPLGIYISGVATLLPSWAISNKGYSLTIAAIGTNKTEIIGLMKRLQPNYFDQVILVGHPFFLKDVLETGRELKIDWKKRNIKMLLASEGFSEVWRDYMLNLVGKKSAWYDITSVYASTDLLLMAQETPLTILIKRLAERRKQFSLQAFSSSTVPSIFQYNPFIRYAESDGGNLLFTSASGVPTVRFNIEDRGQIIPFGSMLELVEKYQPKWRKYLKERVQGAPWKLPFMTLFGRANNVLSFHLANIRPEYIRNALDYGPFLKKLTGKFAIRKILSPKMDEQVEVNVELRKNVHPDQAFSNSVQKRIVQKLREQDYRYEYISDVQKNGLEPIIQFWPYQDPKYFQPGVKPKYIYRD